MDRGPLECTGGNWNGYVPSTCIQALIFVTTFFRKSHQKSECLTQMTKHASKTIKFELLGAQTACGDCSNAIPTRPHIPSLGIPSLTISRSSKSVRSQSCVEYLPEGCTRLALGDQSLGNTGNTSPNSTICTQWCSDVLSCVHARSIVFTFAHFGHAPF